MVDVKTIALNVNYILQSVRSHTGSVQVRVVIMTIPRSIRRITVGILGTTGLAYPACAAICPRGWGGCPFPGRCFLYTDIDANSLCDYTAPGASVKPPAGSVTSPVTVPVTPTPAANASVPPLPARAGPAVFSLLPDALVAGIIMGIILCAVLFALFRSGAAGIRIEKTGPALAVSGLFALGISEMITYLLMGAGASASVFAAVYLLGGSLLAAYVWKSGEMSRSIALASVIMSTLFGFVILAPLMPLEFVGIVSLFTVSRTFAPGIVGILAGIALAGVIGRTFCGHLCPVGSVQEIVYHVPVPKIDIRRTQYLEAFRLVVFVATVIAAVYLVNLMEFTGVYAFFSLTLSAGLMVFVGFLGLSGVLYRPICRGICPFGLLFSLPAHFSRFGLRRTDACINCRKCEKACPAHVAGRDASKRECYLCARCTGACPVRGALSYENRH
jgi:ferredoxin-type protein NapH